MTSAIRVSASSMAPPNNAMKLTKPIQVRAPRHSASLHRAPCRSARSSPMRASQLIAVFCGPLS
jgi:hypothetical protein